VLHWPLAFPQVFASGGFDCVLGNPPWERIKLQEEEFFATRHPAVANGQKQGRAQPAHPVAARACWRSTGHPTPAIRTPTESEAEQRLYAEFIITRRTAEASQRVHACRRA
jgi:hypothetical protein